MIEFPSSSPPIDDDRERTQVELTALKDFIGRVDRTLTVLDESAGEAELMSLLELLLESALAAVGARDGSLLVVDETTSELVFILVKGEVPPDSLQWHRIPIDKGIAGWVVERRRPIVVHNPKLDDRFFNAIDTEFGFSTRSVLAVPLIHDDQVLGVMEALNKQGGGRFSSDDGSLINLACQLSARLLQAMMQQTAATLDEHREPEGTPERASSATSQRPPESGSTAEPDDAITSEPVADPVGISESKPEPAPEDARPTASKKKTARKTAKKKTSKKKTTRKRSTRKKAAKKKTLRQLAPSIKSRRDGDDTDPPSASPPSPDEPADDGTDPTRSS